MTTLGPEVFTQSSTDPAFLTRRVWRAFRRVPVEPAPHLPPAIALAYVPRKLRLPRVGGWRALPLSRRLLSRALFWIGNAPPPYAFSLKPASLGKWSPQLSGLGEPNSLARFRRTREFRACLWITDISVWNDAGHPCIGYTLGHEVGYTPPWTPGMRRLRTSFVPGQGNIEVEQVEFRRNRILLTIAFKFRIRSALAGFLNANCTRPIFPTCGSPGVRVLFEAAADLYTGSFPNSNQAVATSP